MFKEEKGYCQNCKHEDNELEFIIMVTDHYERICPVCESDNVLLESNGMVEL